MLVHKLESLQETQSFVGRPADRQIVNVDMSQHAIGVDQKQTSGGHTNTIYDNWNDLK